MKEAFRRLAAYFIDLSIVFLVSAFISSCIITATNPEKYISTYNDYSEYQELSDKFFKDFSEYYNDNKLDETEYNSIIEDYGDFPVGLEELYKDGELTKKEYENINLDTVEKYTLDFYYILGKVNTVNSIVNIVLMIVYFVIIQYFTKGQTIGKKILKLRVYTVEGARPSINHLMLRSLVITDIIWSSIRLICLYSMDEYGYWRASSLLNTIMYIVLFVSLLFVIYRKDRRSLQDLFAGTKVVEFKK